MDLEKLLWLIEEHYKEEKKHYEILAHTISVGYARTQTKKKIKLFEDNNQKVNGITEEERKVKFEDMKKSFGK